MRPLRSLVLLLALACAASAGPRTAETARALRDGELTAAEAEAAWTKDEVGPDAALAALAKLPLLDAPRRDHQATLTDAAGRTTDLRVVLPPDGPADDGRYRVLIVLHGLGGKSDQGVKGAAGLVPPHTILLSPSALKPRQPDPSEDVRNVSPVASVFKSWWGYGQDAFALKALDYVARRYPIDPDRVALAGYSMGGFGAWNIGLRYHDRFAGLLPMAGGISREEYVFSRDRRSRTLLDNARMVPCFFIHGGADEVVPVQFDRWTAEELKAKGIEHEYLEVPKGPHVLKEFAESSGEVKKRLQGWLAGRVRDAHPKRVVHRALGAYHGGAYWVRIDGLTGLTAAVDATIEPDNAITVTTRGVNALTVYLDPAHVDPAKPVKITVDGKVAFQGKVEPSLAAVAGSHARTRDAALTYRHAVRLEVEPQAAEETEGALDRLFRRPG
jgi:predicted esterase